MIKETLLKKQIIQYLNYQGIIAWANNSGTFFIKGKNGKTRCFKGGIKGLPDISGILKGGRALFIETKIKPNKPTEVQQDFIDRANKQGALAFVVYSLEDVINKLK